MAAPQSEHSPHLPPRAVLEKQFHQRCYTAGGPTPATSNSGGHLLKVLWGAVSPHVERRGPAIAGMVIDRVADKALSPSDRKKGHPDERFGRIESGLRHLTEVTADCRQAAEVVHNQLSSQLATLNEKALQLQEQNREAGNQITLLGARLDTLEQRLKTWGIVLSSGTCVALVLLIWLDFESSINSLKLRFHIVNAWFTGCAVSDCRPFRRTEHESTAFQALGRKEVRIQVVLRHSSDGFRRIPLRLEGPCDPCL